ncbi:cyclin-L1 [Contarinia nasturtii]|uniref:cyclin-L1 n=1 Tax=Contarinia nasturtii TaxID=265458 RepID=UPI0012D48E98|nr:cyclin-L1 [Contarinia nasturtii]
MTQKTTLPRQFGKITLTLENCLLSDNKLQETPSQHDGLDKETETDLRVLGCELIQIAGILLKLPQVAMATGQVLFQRFYYSKSYLRDNMEITAMSCICLASKIEEAPRRIRDVINVFHLIKQVRGQKPIHPMILDASYVSLKNQVIKAERRVLKELGFCVHVKHPHKLIVMYLQVLGYEENKRLMQMAWNFMNDSLRTDVFVRYNPESIACACIYLTARKIDLPLPNNPSWYGVFNVNEDDILDISYKIMELYRRPKPNAEVLEQTVEKLKKVFEEIRNKNKTGQNTPPVTISVDRNDKSYNSWSGFISRAAPVTNTNVNENEKQPTQPISSDSQSNVPQSDSAAQTNQNSQQPGQCQNESSNTENTKKSSKSSREQQSARRSPSKSSRSGSISQSPNDNSRSRSHKKTRDKSRSRSRTSEKHKRSRVKSRNYSRSASLSPSRYNKKRDREKSDYGHSNGDIPHKKHFSSEKHHDYRSRDKERAPRHERYSNNRRQGGQFRDRKR